MGTTVSTVPPIDRRTDRGSTLSHIAQGRPAGRCWREMARCEGPAPLGGSTLPPMRTRLAEGRRRSPSGGFSANPSAVGRPHFSSLWTIEKVDRFLPAGIFPV
ncbi:Hypothetical protein NTJ_12797 [Nesidiocoris tenuis]|uniref:Uncharacterized protein n=1 Tax=Nesidiocoris tenuis TaxID=355587 RepID=A0ABN7B7Z2_9HEMI|nr:Hypothetical protein NTJ_12797 [Nesidiocoris tenuis]